METTMAQRMGLLKVIGTAQENINRRGTSVVLTDARTVTVMRGEKFAGHLATVGFETRDGKVLSGSARSTDRHMASFNAAKNALRSEYPQVDDVQMRRTPNGAEMQSRNLVWTSEVDVKIASKDNVSTVGRVQAEGLIFVTQQVDLNGLLKSQKTSK